MADYYNTTKNNFSGTSTNPGGMRWDARLQQWVPEDDVDPVANPADPTVFDQSTRPDQQTASILPFFDQSGRPDMLPVVPPYVNPQANRPDIAPVVNPQANRPDIAPVVNPQANRPDVAPVVNPQANRPDIDPVVPSPPPFVNPQANRPDIDPVVPSPPPFVNPQANRPDVDPVVPPVVNPQANRPDVDPVVPPVVNPQADRPDVDPVVPPYVNPQADRPDVDPVVAPYVNPQADRPDADPVVAPYVNPQADRPDADRPGMTIAELSQFLGQDPSAYLSGLGSDDQANMDADGDGTVSQEELDSYTGNVYSYNVPDPALTGVTDLNQMAIDYLSGTGDIPGIANFMDDLDMRHAQEDADFEQSLVNRGITDSSIADNMRRQHTRSQNNERAMLETNLAQNMVPLYTQTGMGYEGLLDQDRQQSLGDFFSFLDRQVAENRWTDQQAAQGLSLMLNALGMGTINPSMPAFNIPAGQPGAGQSIGNLIGNLGTAYLGSGADLSWLGG